MPANVELKARVHDRAGLEERVATRAVEGPVTLRQEDTYFRVAEGRLKLREAGDGTGELIAYDRADATGPELSRHVRAQTLAPEGLRRTLGELLGVRGRVVKVRTLYLIGRTRVHLDRVEGLGDFVELEVVLDEGEDPGRGEREANALAQELGIEPGDLEAGSYLDLLDRPED